MGIRQLLGSIINLLLTHGMVVLGALLIPISRIVVLSDTTPNPVPIHSMVEQNVISSSENTARFNVQIIEMSNEATSQIPTLAGSGREITTESQVSLSLSVWLSTIFMSVYPWAAIFVLAYSLAGYFRFLKKLRNGYIRPQDYDSMLLQIFRKANAYQS